IERFLCIPVVDKGRVTLLMGLANKTEPYNSSDVLNITLLLEGMWNYTRKVQMENALRVSEERYCTLVESFNEGIIMVKNGLHIYVNTRFHELLGYSQEEVLGQPLTVWVHPHDKEKVISMTTHRVGDQKLSIRDEITGIKKDGSIIYLEISATQTHLYGDVVFLAFLRDVTERKRAEEQILKERELFFTTLESYPSGVALIDKDGNYLFINSRFTEITGYTKDEIRTGRDWFSKAYPNLEYRKKAIRAWKENIKSLGTHEERLFTVTCKDGTTREIEFRTTFLKDFTITTLDDVTRRVQAERALREAKEKYRSIFDNAIEGIFQSTLEGRHLSVNPAYAKMLGYDSPEELIESITDIQNQLYVEPEDLNLLLKLLEERGYVEGFQTRFPRKDGSIIWIFSNIRAVKDPQGKILYLEGSIEDITERTLAQEEFLKSVDKLRRLFVGTIQALSTTIETRDLYAAGHQRRVSALVRSIAQEMGLSADIVEGIRVAGLVHDIGKISVPIELLSKPTRLTEAEFLIIKIHPQSGYEILKDLDFPWPVAEIVLQHHERLDGSGYPRNLKGDQIILEARIIAVADVVESMASHRPYRPALGIDAALEEITQNSGLLYDERTVNACVSLFRKNGFRWD
ncbi:MAG: PAS domain S-box protein, partial [Desulfatiglandales bacterium]